MALLYDAVVFKYKKTCVPPSHILEYEHRIPEM